MEIIEMQKEIDTFKKWETLLSQSGCNSKLLVCQQIKKKRLELEEKIKNKENL